MSRLPAPEGSHFRSVRDTEFLNDLPDVQDERKHAMDLIAEAIKQRLASTPGASLLPPACITKREPELVFAFYPTSQAGSSSDDQPGWLTPFLRASAFLIVQRL